MIVVNTPSPPNKPQLRHYLETVRLLDNASSSILHVTTVHITTAARQQPPARQTTTSYCQVQCRWAPLLCPKGMCEAPATALMVEQAAAGVIGARGFTLESLPADPQSWLSTTLLCCQAYGSLKKASCSPPPTHSNNGCLMNNAIKP
ncbi:hypothetical protein HaLaN_02513 [Haematococcus lacustris]|uniref:Uncharacterized protein n=1 Tax=Haematococcus lacustris TaxID=44745 RepID=A0A699YBW9_HAELA|nr:hypothetical protein HaLaN_02513 [Haematococcus lacustris]